MGVLILCGPDAVVSFFPVGSVFCFSHSLVALRNCRYVLSATAASPQHCTATPRPRATPRTNSVLMGAQALRAPQKLVAIRPGKEASHRSGQPPNLANDPAVKPCRRGDQPPTHQPRRRPRGGKQLMRQPRGLVVSRAFLERASFNARCVACPKAQQRRCAASP